jgi:hypothetical protein
MNSVKRIMVFLLMVFFISPLTVSAASCSPSDIIKLEKGGWSLPKIEEFCGKSVSPAQQQAVALSQKCATAYGFCILSHLPAAPLGTPCYCVNKFNGKSDAGKIVQ